MTSNSYYSCTSKQATITAGTASQSTTTITGSGTSWNANVVGGVIVWANGATASIKEFVSTTSLIATDSKTVANQAYTIYYGSIQITKGSGSTYSHNIGQPNSKLKNYGNLNIYGTDNGADTPSINYYSQDQYAVKQTLVYNSDSIEETFDCYWDDGAYSWKSSSNTNSFVLSKYNGLLSIFAGSATAGSNVSMTDLFILTPGGKLTLTNGIYLQTTGGTASKLNYNEEYTIPSGSLSGPWTSSQTISFKLSRIGNVVTLSWPTVTATSNGTASIITVAGAVPSRFLPASNLYFSTTVSDNTMSNGKMHLNSSTGVITIYSGKSSTAGNFGTFTTVGIYAGSVTWNYNM